MPRIRRCHDRLDLIARRGVSQLLHYVLDGKRSWPLPRWELLVAREVLRHDCLSRKQHKGVLDEPFDVIASLVLGPFEGIRPQIEQHG